MLEALHNDTLPPILCTALCATVSMYISRSREQRQLSMYWAQEVDAYLFSHLNDLSLLNLQIIVLSVFQHFVYRQFGRVWLMLGMATRLAFGIQLNKETCLEAAQELGWVSRECARRLVWSIFVQDKIHAGGVEEFAAMPEAWLHIPLPLSELHFQREQDHCVGTLRDDVGTLSRNGLGMNGYMVILQNLRYLILQ